VPLLSTSRKPQPTSSIDAIPTSVQGREGPPVTRSLEGGWWDRFLRQSVFHWLEPIKDGRIEIVDGSTTRLFGSGSLSSLAAKVQVHDPRFYRHVVLGGELGAAEAFIRGYWDCDDLVDLVRIFCRNSVVSQSGEKGLARLARPFRRVAHLLRRNTVSGSRRNIAQHYDLSNEFFALFLDDTMTYSCAIFEDPDSTLEEASEAKYDRICRKLDLGPQDNVLEIGCGWGGFAIHAATRYGCRVTATTISRRQRELASQRVREAGLKEQVVVMGEDYRRLRGVYDKLVSVEMIEAVGDRYFDTYFRTCNNLLKPDGMMLLQAITIADQNYETYRRSVDFIQRYVFPGGFLPSIEAISRSLTRSTDFRLFHLEDITPHYARTLELWRQRFHGNLAEIRQLGLPEDLLRIWEFYFGYCEGGFRERVIGTVQMLLTRSQCRRDALTPRL
jgi:cyclopropane-fatty-acyl-phospholipid synthase